MISRRMVAATSITFSLLLTSHANAASLAGTTCKKVGATKTLSGVKYVCSKAGKKTLWKKVQLVPSSSVPALPSLETQWNATGSNALNIFNATAAAGTPGKFSHAATFFFADGFWNASEVELRKRINRSVAFWNRFYGFKAPTYVLGGRSDRDQEWACRLTASQSDGQLVLKDCLAALRPDPDIVRAWYFSSLTSSHWYLMAGERNLFDPKYDSRIEYFYTCGMQDDAGGVGWGFQTPCWFVKSGSSYLGILIATEGDARLFLKMRNAAILATATDRWSAGDFSEWVKSANINRFDRDGNDTCDSLSTTGLYQHGLLSAEWIISQIGVQGFVELIVNAGATSWSSALPKALNMSEAEMYRQMGEYMYKEVSLARKNASLLEDKK